jgi:hypothetical protein
MSWKYQVSANNDWAYVVSEASVSTFSTQYQAVYDSWTTKPAIDVAIIQDTMVRAWIASGFWASTDVIYVFAVHTNDASEALINWKSPGTNDAILTGATFTAYEGFTGDGASTYLQADFEAANDAVNFTQNDASVGIYNRKTRLSGCKLTIRWV